MLKIKEYRYTSEDGETIRREKIDLKELEKFGFKNRYGFFYKSKPTEKEVIELEIDLNTREIKMNGFGDLHHTREDTLYDLIQARLVEKVEE